MTKWQKIEDLPREHNVLCSDGSTVWINSFEYGEEIRDAKRWMPLPDLPRVGKKYRIPPLGQRSWVDLDLEEIGLMWIVSVLDGASLDLLIKKTSTSPANICRVLQGLLRKNYLEILNLDDE